MRRVLALLLLSSETWEEEDLAVFSFHTGQQCKVLVVEVVGVLGRSSAQFLLLLHSLVASDHILVAAAEGMGGSNAGGVPMAEVAVDTAVPSKSYY